METPGSAKPTGRQVVLRHVFADSGTHIGEKRAQLFPFLSPGSEGVVTLQQDAEVVFQAEVNRVLEGQRNGFRLDFPWATLPLEGALTGWETDSGRHAESGSEPDARSIRWILRRGKHRRGQHNVRIRTAEHQRPPNERSTSVFA